MVSGYYDENNHDGCRTVDWEESGLNESGYDCADYDCDDYDCADEIVSDGGRHDDICGDNYENGGCRDGGFPLRRLLRMTKQTDCGRQTGTAIE